MIFVTLGTQDKSFKRLLEAIDKQINNKTIKEEVIVQAGYTKYKSKNMKIFDLVAANEFDNYMKKADIVITHGGAGSILTALKYNKKVIKELTKEGYILELENFDELNIVIDRIKEFKPKKFVSNTNNIIKIINKYIEEDNNISWLNKIINKFKNVNMMLTKNKI